MSELLSKEERKTYFIDAIKAHEARIHASIHACKERRAENKRKSQELAKELEQIRLKHSANLKKRMVIMFFQIDEQIVILTIVDPSFMKSKSSVEMKHHITYGSPNYDEIYMKASYTFKGKRRVIEENNRYSYTVSTTDGSNFHIIDDTDGTTRLSFKTLIHYDSLVGTSVSGVKFDQFFYDPFQDSFDDKTAKFHKELDRLIRADADYVKENPELSEEVYIRYFRY